MGGLRIEGRHRRRYRADLAGPCLGVDKPDGQR